MVYNPNLDFVNLNAYIKCRETLSLSSQYIEQNLKTDINQGPPLCKNLRKMTGNYTSLDLVNINAHVKFGRNPLISSRADAYTKFGENSMACWAMHFSVSDVEILCILAVVTVSVSFVSSSRCRSLVCNYNVSWS